MRQLKSLLVARRVTGAMPLVLALAAGGGLAASSLTASQVPADATQQTFRLRIDSVSVDVIVLDRDGEPVLDLTADDFEIVEEGAPQEVETFKLIDVDASHATRPTTHREILSLDDQRREAGRDDTRVLVILLDDYHVRRGNSLRAREQLAQFVSTLADNDLVAVTYPLSATSGLTFSRNHDTTARSVMSFEGRKYDYTPRNAFESQYQNQPPEVLERIRNDVTMRALESLSAYMASLRDGRKTLLFVSEGLSGTLPAGVNTTGGNPFASGGQGSLNDSVRFFNSAEIMGQLRHVYAAANRSNTSIYTIDPRGLAASEYDIDDVVSTEIDRRALAESTDTLRAIAGETGGRAIVNRNNPLPELRQMVRDNSAYYLLGYTSSRAPRDGKFQEIRVRVKRPNVEVRARRGYWAYTEDEVTRAEAPARAEAPPDVTAALNTLALSADPGNNRVVRLWTGAVPRGVGEPYTVTFAWESVDSGTGSRAATVVDRISITAEALDGRVLFQGVASSAPGQLSPAGRVSFAAPPGTVRARLVIEDAEGERIDADEVSFEVPAYEPGVLAVTPPEVFRGRTARDLQTVRAAEAPVPTASRAFSRTERLLLRYHVLNAGASPPILSLRLLNHTGEPMADLAAPTRLADGRYESAVTLAALPPGDFLVELTASSGDAQARSLLAVRIGG